MSFRSLRESRTITEEDRKAFFLNRKQRKCRAHSAPIAFVSDQEDIDEQDHEGKTALSYAVTYGETKLVKYLLENNADPDIGTKRFTYPIHEAVDNGDIDIIQHLISYGCDINVNDFLGQTPLIRAALFGDIEATKLLIKSGADFNRKEITGKSALLVALQEGNDEIAALLKKKGSNVNIIDNHGQSALYILIHRRQKCSITLCQKLFKAGYDFENDCHWLSKDLLHRSIIDTGVVSSVLRKLGFEKLNIDDLRTGLLNDIWFHEGRSRLTYFWNKMEP